MRSWDPISGGDFGSDLELFGARLVAMLLVMLIKTGEDGVEEFRAVDLDVSPIFGRLRFRIGVAGVAKGSWEYCCGGVGSGGRLLSVEGRGEPVSPADVAYVVTENRDGG